MAASHWRSSRANNGRRIARGAPPSCCARFLEKYRQRQVHEWLAAQRGSGRIAGYFPKLRRVAKAHSCGRRGHITANLRVQGGISKILAGSDTGILAKQQISMNDFRRQWNAIRHDVMAAVEAVGESGWYILGDNVRLFESALAACWPAQQAVGVASGMDAIEISLRAAGLRPGERVLTTPLSAFATTLAIVRAGGIPVYCDVDDSGLMDLTDARAACMAMPEIRWLIPVHLYGFPINRVSLASLIADFGLTCIEDCAQSIGAHPDGLTGVAAATSFYPTKNLGAMGDGGAVMTNDASIALSVRRLRDYGQSAKYRHSEIGWNSRLDEIQAAILHRAVLPRLQGWTSRRREIAAYYMANWHSQLVCPLPAGCTNACWHLFPVRVAAERKASLMEWLRAAGVGYGEHYPIPIPDQEAMRDQSQILFGDIPNARSLAAAQLSLPIHPFLSNEEADAVLNAIADWPG